MLRTLIWFIYFFIYLFASVPALIKVYKLTKQNRIPERDDLVQQTVQKWAKSLVNFTGSQITVRGIENILKEGPVLFVANHQGYFDIPILLGFINKPKGFIAKAELIKFPIINRWMKFINCIFIKRDNPREALRAINEGKKKLQAGHSLVLFPEGTRSSDGSLGEFKAGSLKLATRSGVPIVPIAIKGAHQVMRKGSLLIKPAKIELTISPVIGADIVQAKDAKELADVLKRIISDNL